MIKAELNYNMPDQSGRVALVTGANSGLGFEASKSLARSNARVIMACRSTDKGQVARQSILDQFPDCDLQLEELDVSSLDSVRDFARRITPELDRLDLLINNAGVMAIPYAKSLDGYEMQFATNHLGHFLLAGLLLPLLLKSPDSRVVAISSIAARNGIIDFEDLMGENDYDSWKAYNQSKLANLIFAFELQRRLTSIGSNTSAVAAHPGASMTNLFSTPGGGLIKRVLTPVIRPFMYQSQEEGVQSILYAATSPDANPGGYYAPSRLGEMKGPPTEAKVPKAARDEATARGLWSVSEELVGYSYLGDSQ